MLLPTIVLESLKEPVLGTAYRYSFTFTQTEKQPKPVLIGFNTDEEKDFFQRLITVEDIGPMKAAKALTVPVQPVLSKQTTWKNSQKLKGIGKKTAQ